MKNVAEAVKRDLILRGVTQTELGNMLGVSQSYINSLLTGRKAFGKKQAARFNNLFGYSEEFLLTGKGELSKKPNAGVSTPPASPATQSQSLNNANIDQRINELLTITSNLHNMFESVNDRLAEATAIITKSQQQFDKVLQIYEQKQNGHYGMVAEDIMR